MCTFRSLFVTCVCFFVSIPGISFSQNQMDAYKREAIESYIQGIHFKPDFADTYFNLGMLYVDGNDINSALEQHKILFRLDIDLARKLHEAIQEKNSKNN